MSAPVTLSNLVLAVQQRANIENQNGFITPAELRGRINYACMDVYDRLVAARAQEYFRAQQILNVVANTPLYGLAADAYQIISVDVVLGNNQTLSAKPYMEFERNRFKYAPGWNYTQPVYYRHQGTNINFIPTPSGAYVVDINYYPRFTPFVTDGTGDGNTFDGINGWEEAAIWRVVSEIKDKGEEDPSYAWSRYQDMCARIDGLAAMRDAGTAERVHDVHSSDDGSWGEFR